MAYTFEITSMDIKTLWALFLKGLIDIRPEWQRMRVFKPVWGRALIRSLLEDVTSSVLHVRKLKDGRYQIIDGQQRITAIMAFLNGEFACASGDDGNVNIKYQGEYVKVKPGKYKEMMRDKNADIIQEILMNFKFAVIEYSTDMTDDEASHVYCTINNGTPMNNQEIANAYIGVVPTWVRNSSRGSEYNNGECELPVVKHFKFNNDRLAHDETIARSVVYEYEYQAKNRYASATVQAIKDIYTRAVYRKDVEKFKPIANGVTRRWNMVRRLIEGSGTTKLFTKNPAQIITLFQFTYAMDSEFGSNAKIDYKTFAPKLWDAMIRLSDRKLQKGNPSEKTRFQVLLGRYIGHEIVEKNALVMLELSRHGEPDAYGVTVKDKVRGFSLKDKYRKWVEQDYCCAVTKNPLNCAEAIGGHIIPHSKGGLTVYENLVILSEEVNSAMGDTPYQEFLDKRYLLA